LPKKSTNRGDEDGVLSSGSIAKLAWIIDSEKSTTSSKINLNTQNSNFYHTKAFAYNIVGVFFKWASGTLIEHQTLSPAVSWTPDSSGIYKAEIFVWESFLNPDALSQLNYINITVS